MEFQLLITDYFIRISDELERVLDGLTIEDLNKHPAPGVNSIGWLAWHLTRSHDRNLSELYRKQQLWIKVNGMRDSAVLQIPLRQVLVTARKRWQLLNLRMVKPFWNTITLFLNAPKSTLRTISQRPNLRDGLKAQH